MKKLSIISLMLISSTCFALDQEQVLLGKVDDSLGDTSITSSSSVIGNAFELTAGSGSGVVSLKLGSSFFQNNMSLVLSSPLDKGKSDKDFNKSNKLVKNTSLKYNYQFFSNYDTDINPVDWAPLVEFCELKPDLFGYPKKDVCSQKVLDELIKNYKGDTRSLLDITAQVNSVLSQPIHLFGFTTAIDQKEYEFFASGIDTKGQTKYSGAGSLYYVFVKPNSFSVKLEYEYQSTYQAGNVETRCPVGGGTFVICKDAYNAKPEGVSKRISSIELRSPLRLMSFPIAISPTVSYDNEDHLFEVGVPIYLFQDTKSKLTGGFRADWANNDHDWDFSVFVGSKFDVF